MIKPPTRTLHLPVLDVVEFPDGDVMVVYTLPNDSQPRHFILRGVDFEKFVTFDTPVKVVPPPETPEQVKARIVRETLAKYTVIDKTSDNKTIVARLPGWSEVAVVKPSSDVAFVSPPLASRPSTHLRSHASFVGSLAALS